ncbi:MAG: DUF4357 domain-containing protein [Clostridia bacterium]|nr:DUF4357 domain-containing protein [Clostridia bacterium]MDY5555602.1 DUF4357 domain-containing protein [Blautia sp.]
MSIDESIIIEMLNGIPEGTLMARFEGEKTKIYKIPVSYFYSDSHSGFLYNSGIFILQKSDNKFIIGSSMCLKQDISKHLPDFKYRSVYVIQNDLVGIGSLQYIVNKLIDKVQEENKSRIYPEEKNAESSKIDTEMCDRIFCRASVLLYILGLEQFYDNTPVKEQSGYIEPEESVEIENNISENHEQTESNEIQEKDIKKLYDDIFSDDDSEQTDVKALDLSDFTNRTDIDNKELFYINLNEKYSAGVKLSKGFLLLKGSYVNKDYDESLPESVKLLREAYLNDEEKYSGDATLVDIKFRTPTMAAGFVCGRMVNGNDAWKKINQTNSESFTNKREDTDVNNNIIKNQDNGNISAEDNKKDSDMLYLIADSYSAAGFYKNGHFIVKKGSSICKYTSYTCSAEIKIRRKQLVKDGVIQDGLFVVNAEFDSEKTAAQIITGHNAANSHWKHSDGTPV